MEKWVIDRYEAPYLVFDDVFLDPESQGPVILLKGQYFDVDGVQEGRAREVVETLASLRKPDSARWGSVRADSVAPVPWRDVLEQLDNLAMIKDAAPVPDSGVEDLERDVERAVTAVGTMVGPAGAAPLTGVLSEVRRHLEWLVEDLVVEVCPELAGERAVPRAPDPLLQPNFFVATLGLQARYWRQSAPLALLAVDELVRRLGSGGTGEVGHPPARFARMVAEIGTTMYDARDLRAQLKSAAVLLWRATTQGAATICSLPEVERAPVSGINFLVEAEQVTSDALEKLGPTRFVEELSAAVGARRRRLAIGCYVEEYHVTCRFVEMITPMMAKRLSSDLRRRMFRYFGEEVGHESFELATCRSLGVDAEALTASLPLPLRTAFVDTFTAIAAHDPVGYLISIFVTEGMLGDKSPLGELLDDVENAAKDFKKVHVKHEALNIELNHSSLSRLMMRELTRISVHAQERALRSLLYLIELNHRGWDEVCEFYGDPKSATHHGWFE